MNKEKAMRLRLCKLSFIVLMVLSTDAIAQPFSFAKIADSQTLIPDGSGETFDGYLSGFAPPAISGGHVVFVGQSKANKQGVYKSSEGFLSRIADFTSTVPLTSGPFSFINGRVRASGSGLMFPGGNSTRAGIYGDFGSGLEVVIDTQTPAQGGPFAGGVIDYWQEGRDAVVSSGPASTLKPTIYHVRNGLVGVVADTTTFVPGGTGTFKDTSDQFAEVRLSGGRVTFTGIDSAGKKGIYRQDGLSLGVVLDSSSSALPGQGTFTSFGQISPSGDDIAFGAAVSAGGGGVYSRIGGTLTEIAALGQVMPGGATLSGLRLVSLDGGSVVFFDPTASVIYTNFDGVLRRLIGSGDTLDGKTVSFVNMSEAGRDGNKVAFSVIFSGNSPISPDSALYVATLPGPGGVAVVGFGLLFASRRRRPN